MEALGLEKWIEIDVDAVINNLYQVQDRLGERQVKLIAVIKADAYGHGAVPVARCLSREGVEFFAVSFLEEALELRRAGIQADILLLTPLISPHQFSAAIANHITVTVTSFLEYEMIDRITAETGHSLTMHLKTDTGLGRFGLNLDEILEICRLASRNAFIYIEGIYTHMAEAAFNPAYTHKQFRQFEEITAAISSRGFDIPCKHCANSAVVLNYPKMYLNAVRVGTLLSGQHPAGKFQTRLKLKDPFIFKTRIISLRNMEEGDYLGYNRTHRLKKPARIAVIPVGFEDGLALDVVNKPAGPVDMLKHVTKTVLRYFNADRFTITVKIRGREYPVRGKVFMQMALVELPPHLDIAVGEEVEVPVRKVLVPRNISRVYTQKQKLLPGGQEP